jgi:hypothetical protein
MSQEPQPGRRRGKTRVSWGEQHARVLTQKAQPVQDAPRPGLRRQGLPPLRWQQQSQWPLLPGAGAPVCAVVPAGAASRAECKGEPQCPWCFASRQNTLRGAGLSCLPATAGICLPATAGICLPATAGICLPATAGITPGSWLSGVPPLDDIPPCHAAEAVRPDAGVPGVRPGGALPIVHHAGLLYALAPLRNAAAAAGLLMRQSSTPMPSNHTNPSSP